MTAIIPLCIITSIAAYLFSMALYYRRRYLSLKRKVKNNEKYYYSRLLFISLKKYEKQVLPYISVADNIIHLGKYSLTLSHKRNKVVRIESHFSLNDEGFLSYNSRTHTFLYKNVQHVERLIGLLYSEKHKIEQHHD